MDICVCATEGIQARRKRVKWDAPAELPEAQSILGNLVHFLSNHFREPRMFEMARHGPGVERPEM